MEQPTLPLIVLPFPLVLLPGARATFPIAANIADALLRLIESSPSNPVLVAVPLVKNEGNTSVNKWGVTARITRFVRPRTHSDEPHLLTLTGIARVRLTDLPQLIYGPVPLPRVDVSHPPSDSDSPPTADIVQVFNMS
jgi:ATP-dependent Lon protease